MKCETYINLLHAEAIPTSEVIGFVHNWKIRQETDNHVHRNLSNTLSEDTWEVHSTAHKNTGKA